MTAGSRPRRRALRPVFPFTALVGQERMKRALMLNAVNPRLGGVLIRGEKGTAKSTAVRALASLLPEIEVVVGCHYGCDPATTLTTGAPTASSAPTPLPTASAPRPDRQPAGRRHRGPPDRHARHRARPSRRAGAASSRACWRRPTAASSTSTRSTC